MIEVATRKVAATMMGLMALGNRWRIIMAPAARADRLRSREKLLLLEREKRSPHQPGHRHPGQHGDDQHDGEHAGKGRAAQRLDGYVAQRQRQDDQDKKRGKDNIMSTKRIRMLSTQPP